MPEISQMERERMARISAGARTVSDKIRALDAAGYPRAEIARFLNKRYQHVRNVLVQDEERARGRHTSAATATMDDAPSTVWVKLGEGGRIVIPVGLRQALGVSEGDDLQLSLEEDHVAIRSKKAAFGHIRGLLKKYVPTKVSLVDELIAERRAEAVRENSGD